MDEASILKRFQHLKVLTISQIAGLLTSSVITARRYLKKWRAYTSFNHNGRYYTLPMIPHFDQNGIWKYRTVLFSQYGNLKQTIIHLVRKSDRGLSAKEIAQILEIPSNSSIFSQLENVHGIRREKQEGHFIYFSDEHETYEKQRAFLPKPWKPRLPSDAQAVQILVEYIKNPNIGVDKLSTRLAQKGTVIKASLVQSLLEHHDLLGKKTPDTTP